MIVLSLWKRHGGFWFRVGLRKPDAQTEQAAKLSESSDLLSLFYLVRSSVLDDGHAEKASANLLTACSRMESCTWR